MGTVIMETAHTGKCATPLASMNSEYAYAGPTRCLPVSSAVRADGPAADGPALPRRTRRPDRSAYGVRRWEQGTR
jgi:hypothetical protein